MWYDEVKDLNPEEIDYFTGNSPNGITGHYTQMVWAKTDRLGCGYRQENKENDWFQPATLKCNYVEGGNMPGYPIYGKGKACSQCPKDSHCSKSYPGLCTMETDESKDLSKDTGNSILNYKSFRYIFIRLMIPTIMCLNL